MIWISVKWLVWCLLTYATLKTHSVDWKSLLEWYNYCANEKYDNPNYLYQGMFPYQALNARFANARLQLHDFISSQKAVGVHI